MRKLKRLFVLSKDEKVTEKALRRVLISSILGTVLCLNCLIGTTYAWYQYSVTFPENIIAVGSFATSGSYKKGDTSESFEFNGVDSYSFEIKEVGKHEWLLSNKGNVEGYYTVYVTDSRDDATTESFTTETIYPQSLARDVDKLVYVNITVDSEDNYKLPLYVQFVPTWGENPNPPGGAVNVTVFDYEDDTPETTESGKGSTSTETTESKSTETTESKATETTESKATETTESKATESTESKATETTEGKSTETTETKVTETTAPPASTEGSTPTESTEASTPTESTEAGTPTESTEGSTPTESTEGNTPSESTGEPNPSES